MHAHYVASQRLVADLNAFASEVWRGESRGPGPNLERIDAVQTKRPACADTFEPVAAYEPAGEFALRH